MTSPMKIPLNKSFFITIALLIVTATLAHYSALWRIEEKRATSEAEGSKEPLYWVAPMDPNYKRDEPGKSPMGMDLIPVYEQMGGDEEVGTVTISPDVVNNLGVRTAPVTRGRLDLTISTVGYVQYDEDRLVHIHPRVEGWIEKLHVKAAGDPVIQGEPLYALYSPTLVNAQEELLLALKRNNPTLITAAMERLSALQVPHSEINRLKKSGKVSQTITITAPQSGVLDNLNTREGMFVKPGMEMMAIGQLEHIWVIGEIFERQAASVRFHENFIVLTGKNEGAARHKGALARLRKLSDGGCEKRRQVKGHLLVMERGGLAVVVLTRERREVTRRPAGAFPPRSHLARLDCVNDSIKHAVSAEAGHRGLRRLPPTVLYFLID